MLDALRTRLRHPIHPHHHQAEDKPAAGAAAGAAGGAAAAITTTTTTKSGSHSPKRLPRKSESALSSDFRYDDSPAATPRHSVDVMMRANSVGSPSASPRRSFSTKRLSRNLSSIRHKLHAHLHHPHLGATTTSGRASTDAADTTSAATVAVGGLPGSEDASHHRESLQPDGSTTSPRASNDAIPARFAELFSNNGRLHEPGSGNVALYPRLPDLLPLYGTATNTAWTEPMYTIFELPLPESRRHDPVEKAAYVGYLLNAPDGKQTYAIAWGDPLCHPDNFAYVAQRWVNKVESEGKRPLWCCCSEAFMDVLTKSLPSVLGEEPLGTDKLSSSATLDWSALTCIHEDIVDPHQFHVDNVEKFVRTKLRKAHRKGLRIVEAHGRFPDPIVDGSSALTRAQVEEGILAWKESKAAKGAQIHASDTEPWRDLTHRKYFYAVAPKTPPSDADDESPTSQSQSQSRRGPSASANQVNPPSSSSKKAATTSSLSLPNVLLDYHEDEKVVGMCVLAPIQGSKYVVKWLLEFGQDVKGTSECLIVHVLERLRDAGSPDWPTPSPKKKEEDKPLSNREKARRARKARQEAAAARAQQAEREQEGQQGEEPSSADSDVKPGKIVAVKAPVDTLAEAKAQVDGSTTETEDKSVEQPQETLQTKDEGKDDYEAKGEDKSNNQTATQATVQAKPESTPVRIESTRSTVDINSSALFPVLSEHSTTIGERDESARPVCTSLSFGISGGELRPVRNLHVGLRFTTVTAAYNALSKTFHLGSKGSFRTKFGASQEQTAYIAFPQGSMGFKMIDAIVGALKEDQTSETDVEKILDANPKEESSTLSSESQSTPAAQSTT